MPGRRWSVRHPDTVKPRRGRTSSLKGWALAWDCSRDVSMAKMCISACVCMHADMQVCRYVGMRVCNDTMQVCWYAGLSACRNAYMCLCMCA